MLYLGIYDKSGTPVYSPPVDGNALLILVTAQEGRTTRIIFPTIANITGSVAGMPHVCIS